MKKRVSSFGQHGASFLDTLIKKLRFRHIVPHIAAGSVMVDLGCGYQGELLRLLHQKLKQGVGIDMVVSSKQPADNVKLLTGRVDQKIPVRSKSVDAVTALAIIEHLEHPDVLLKEAHRILKPGGLLLLTTPSKMAKPLLEFMAFKLKIISSEEIADHKRYYTQASLGKGLAQAGFDPKRLNVTTFELGMNLLARAIK